MADWTEEERYKLLSLMQRIENNPDFTPDEKETIRRAARFFEGLSFSWAFFRWTVVLFTGIGAIVLAADQLYTRFFNGGS